MVALCDVTDADRQTTFSYNGTSKDLLELSPLHLPAKPSNNLGDWTSMPQSQWCVCKPQRVPTKSSFCCSGIRAWKGEAKRRHTPILQPSFTSSTRLYRKPLGQAAAAPDDGRGTYVPESQLCDIMTAGLDLQVALQL